MDRPISRREQRLRILKRAWPYALGILAFGTALTLFLGWIRPSVDGSRLRTAVVDRGPVEATISASGNVVPERENVITSPVDTRVVRILKNPGDQVSPGEPVLELDVSGSRLDLERLEDRVALKRVERQRARQDLEGRLGEWRSQMEIRSLELRDAEFEAERCRKYLDEGLFSKDDLRRAENAIERAHIQLRQIEEAMENAEDTLRSRLREMDLELGILEKERDEAERILSLAEAHSDQPGILTWVVPSEGTSVRKGEEIARVSDLSAFRVEASLSDIHGSKLSPGMPAIVISGETRLSGRVDHVLPTVKNGVITLEVSLEEGNHPVLRNNLRVEVYVVTARAEDALRVKRGSFSKVDGKEMVFVVRGDRAVRREVRFGITNFESYQVLDGLAEGDKVVLSDMSEYTHMKEVRIR